MTNESSKHIKWVVILTAIFLTSFSIGSAQEILNYNISLELTETTVHEKISVEIFNPQDFSLKTFSYVLRENAEDIMVYDDLGELKSNVTENKGVVISSGFREPLQPNSSSIIAIEFNAPGFVTKSGKDYVFSSVFSLPVGTNEFHLRIKLPEGMGLTVPITPGATSTDIAPLPDNVYSDGTSTIFEWVRHDISKDFAVYVKYTKFYGWRLELKKYVPFGILIAILVGIILYFLQLKKKAELEKIEYMKEDEKLIIQQIMQNEGIVQKKIAEYTGFSKGKVSKIVSDLEERKIIRKEKIGRRTKLYLTEEFKKP